MSVYLEEHPAGLFGLAPAFGGTNNPREKKILSQE